MRILTTIGIIVGACGSIWGYAQATSWTFSLGCASFVVLAGSILGWNERASHE